MLSNHPNCLGGNGPSASSDLIGDVDGPASATDNAVARFDGTTGKLIQNSVVTIADTTGDIAGAQSLTSPASTNLTLTSGLVGTNRVNFPDTLSASSATAGAVTIGNGTAATNVAIGGGKVNIGGTTASTSSTTGALIVSGGAGIAGALNVGGTGTSSFAGTLNISAAQLGSFTSSTANPTSGEAVLSIVGNSNNTDTGYGANRAPALAIHNTSGTSNSYGAIAFQDGGGNATATILGIFENDATNAGSLVFQTRPGSGSPTTALTLSSAQALRLNAYGAGALTTDSSGNVTATSDARAKNIVRPFTTGLAVVRKLTPQVYRWNKDSGLNTKDVNVSLIAQDLIAAGLSEAVATERTVPDMEQVVGEDGTPTFVQKKDANGDLLTKRITAERYSVSDRTVIAALVNAIKDLAAEVDALKASKT